MPIIINNAADIAAMRIAGRLGAEVLDYITPFVVQGVTTNKLDQLCHDSCTIKLRTRWTYALP
jgi:methionyl aminopeptidase